MHRRDPKDGERKGERRENDTERKVEGRKRGELVEEAKMTVAEAATAVEEKAENVYTGSTGTWTAAGD